MLNNYLKVTFRYIRKHICLRVLFPGTYWALQCRYIYS